MNRIETIGDCTLYLGDCRDILPTLGKVDAVVTDPPYKMEIHRRGFAAKRDYYKNLDYGTSTEFELSNEFYQQLVDKLTEINLVFFCNKLMKLDIANWAISQKYTFDELVLLKSAPAPLTNNQWLPDKEHAVHIWDNDKEDAIHIFKNCAVKGDYKTKCTWFSDTNYQDKSIAHPSAKPVYILERILQNISNEQAVILDPFMGSGTTGVACVNLGRSFIGIERELKYFDLACQRIEATLNQPRLFDDKPQPKPEQISMLEAFK